MIASFAAFASVLHTGVLSRTVFKQAKKSKTNDAADTDEIEITIGWAPVDIQADHLVRLTLSNPSAELMWSAERTSKSGFS